jgi:hypothetical protein
MLEGKKYHSIMTYHIDNIQFFVGGPIEYMGCANHSNNLSIVCNKAGLNGSKVEFSGKQTAITIPGQCLNDCG